MAYQNGAFCETLEAIRKRLSDLRAVLDSDCCYQYDSINQNFSLQSHNHRSSHSKHLHYQKPCKIKKSRHHHLHHHDRFHLLNDVKNRKNSNTDKIGRRLYARAIPIEKDYFLDNPEIAMLLKKDKSKKKGVNSNEHMSKKKTPILFPFEKINLKKSDFSESSDYNYSEYDYDDYDENEHHTVNNYMKIDVNGLQTTSNSNKKQITYLKTYQTRESPRKSSKDPHIYQEKGKIIYFDTVDEEFDDDNQLILDFSQNQNSKRNHVKKDKKQNNKLDPIIPIYEVNKSEFNYQNKNITTKKKSKRENLSKKDDENLVIQKRKVNVDLIQINNIKEKEEIISNQKNNKTNANVQPNNETIPQIVQKNLQNKKSESKKIKKKTNQTSQKSLNRKNIKGDVHKIFTFKMCVENQPVCIAIGDIEGNINKLCPIYNLIKTNPSLNFVFIGDLFDDLSDSCSLAEENWECLSLLSEFFVGKNDLSFKSDDNKNIDILSSDLPVSLPSAFNEIRFGKGNFDKIQGRVKFIAGNSECVALSDIQSGCNIVSGDVTKYVFGKGKWKKTITFEKLCLLYRYLKSCYGIIELKAKRVNNASKNSNFKDTVYFRHAPSTFKNADNMISQIPEIKENEINQGNFFFVTGHIRQFKSGFSQNPQAQAFIIDTSPRSYEKAKDESVKDTPINDKRLAVVSFDKNIGFSIECFALPGEFPK